MLAGAGAGAAGRERWRAGRRGGWRGTSQSAASRQLRKPPVFTFLLKEIVGFALSPGAKTATSRHGVLYYLPN